MNLLVETIEAVRNSGHHVKDIIFIGSEQSGHCCTWKQFRKLANFDYNNSFGASAIATDLLIVFSDGTKMWRGEYDGSEWWVYSKPFAMPKKKKSILRLGNNKYSWKTLAEIHNDPH